MKLLYNTGVRLYWLYILAGFPFSRKARLWIRGRRGWSRRIAEEMAGKDHAVWFHCSSLGEFEQGRPVMEELRRRDPEARIVLTFFSPSGYEVRRNYAGADHVFYLPLDTRRNASRFIRTVHPRCAYFIKYEYWYHFIDRLSAGRIPVYLISAVFRDSQIFFRRSGGLFRGILRKFDHIFVQDAASLDLLKSAGITEASISGDTRFDRVSDVSAASEEIKGLREFCGDEPVLVAGSTWPEDESVLLRYIRESGRTMKFIIAPHEITEAGLGRIERSCGKQCLRFSRMDPQTAHEAEVLLVDVMGRLSSIYRYGTLAYIGGGFGHGIHNILEAAAYGMPVLFGPRYGKFREAVELIEQEAAFSIGDHRSFHEKMEKLLTDKITLSECALKTRKYVAENTGATEKILDFSRRKPE